MELQWLNNMEMVPGPGPISTEELVLGPLMRDAWLMVPAVIGWFIAQFFLAPAVGKGLFGKKYTGLKPKDRQDWDIRLVSLINGLLAMRTAYFFFFVPTENNGKTCDFYAVKPGYSYSQIIITAYFVWDCFVSIFYGWGPLYVGHGIFSLAGTFFLTYPYADELSGHFIGTFELSNIFIHMAEMLSHTKSSPSLIQINKIIFAAMFTAVRVVGGTYITCVYFSCAIPLTMSGTAHSNICTIGVMVVIAALQLLQYLWFSTIIKAVLGISDAKR